MAKLVLFLVFVCVQLSTQEDLVEKPNEEITKPEVVPVFEGNQLVGEWVAKSEEDDDDDWNEEDEKWLNEIQALLTGDSDEDEDYDEWSDDEEYLLEKFEKWLETKFKGEKAYDLLQEFVNWMKNDDDDDDWGSDELEFTNFPGFVDEGEDADLVDRKAPIKRFSSV